MREFKRCFSLFASSIFLAVSCVACSSDKLNESEIKIDNIYRGNGKFDRDTFYISALNVDTSKNDSLVKHNILNLGVRHITRLGLNPYFIESKDDKYIVESVWESLMKVGYDGEFYLNLLKQLPLVSEDRKTYLFVLRDDLFWEDGTKITTKDIEFTYKFIMDKSYNGSFDRELLGVKGWESYRDGEKDYIEGLEILDNLSFKVVVDNPNIYTMELLNIYPLSFSYYGEHFFKEGISKIQSMDVKPFGNGVFKFLGYEQDKYFIFEANPFYFKGKSAINTLTFKSVNEQNIINELVTNNIDIARDVVLNDQNILKVSDTEFLSGYIFPNYDYAFIGINHENVNLKDVNVRKAINFCIDREQIVKKIFNGHLNILDAPIDKNFYNLFYDKDEVSDSFNLAKANSILENSGWKKGINGIREKQGKKLEFKFLIQKHDFITSKVFPIIKQNLEKVGISVIPEETDEKISELNSHEMKNLSRLYDLVLINFESNANWITNFMTNGKNNYYFYSNENLDKVLNNILFEFDLTKAEAFYNEAYAIIKDDLPVIPLFQNKQFDVYNGRILGINSVNIFKTFYYDEILLKK